jgi:ankyrin repeat protein
VHTTAILLAFGADPQLADPDGRTPMHMAEQYDHTLAIDLLRRHISRQDGAGI